MVAIEEGDYSVPSGIKFRYFSEIVKRESPRFPAQVWQKKSQSLERSIAPDSLAMIAYSSGTGGQPKGIMLSHRNILHNCRGAEKIFLPALRRSFGRVYPKIFLSFLPLSHSYEHTAGLWFPIAIGAQVHYSESVERLSKNLIEVRPTIMTLVPRLYDLLHTKLLISFEKKSPLGQKLIALALKTGKAKYENRLNAKLRFQYLLADLIVRKRIRKGFGGRIRALVSGGAALPLHLAEFFYFLGLPVCQGYGQTESAPVISVNSPFSPRLDTVGQLLEGVEVKISEDGEILARGPNIMVGYWQNPQATEEALKDGWLHTGDIGMVSEDGYLKITDRKRDIIKLSGGDTLSPAKIEEKLLQQPEIHQVMVYGDGQKSVSAIVVANPNLSRENSHQQVKLSVDRANLSLSQPEKVKNFIIVDEEFTIGNGILTPTLKIRRHVLLKRYFPNLNK